MWWTACNGVLKHLIRRHSLPTLFRYTEPSPWSGSLDVRPGTLLRLYALDDELGGITQPLEVDASRGTSRLMHGTPVLPHCLMDGEHQLVWQQSCNIWGRQPADVAEYRVQLLWHQMRWRQAMLTDNHADGCTGVVLALQ